LVVSRSKADTRSGEQGAEAMRILLDRSPRPDAVFCFNDPLAVGAMKAIYAAGLRIPEDIAIIGCGNLHYDDSLRVPLSSIDQHSERIGQEAARVALAALGSKLRPKPETVVLQPDLIVRASTGRRNPPRE